MAVTIFSERMKQELEANKSKGDWSKWSPHPVEWFWELQYHIAKLQKAIKDDDKDLICEYSADVGNLAEKSFTVFGEPAVCRFCKGKGKGSFAPYDEGQSSCDVCNGTGLKI